MVRAKAAPAGPTKSSIPRRSPTASRRPVMLYCIPLPMWRSTATDTRKRQAAEPRGGSASCGSTSARRATSTRATTRPLTSGLPGRGRCSTARCRSSKSRSATQSSAAAAKTRSSASRSGRDGLLVELEAEMIPYSPEELLRIAEREYVWCEREMRAAASRLGYADWRDGLEHVKNLYEPPATHTSFVRGLVTEGASYVKQHDLVTVPRLAEEAIAITRIPPAKQRVSPFFLGGSRLQISYPRADMEHAAKLMTLRGNNRHFCRATAFHEMIPGHRLQLYVGHRSRPYRARLFSTPFFVEGWALYWEMVLWERGGFLHDARGQDRVAVLAHASVHAHRLLRRLPPRPRQRRGMCRVARPARRAREVHGRGRGEAELKRELSPVVPGRVHARRAAARAVATRGRRGEVYGEGVSWSRPEGQCHADWDAESTAAGEGAAWGFQGYVEVLWGRLIMRTWIQSNAFRGAFFYCFVCGNCLRLGVKFGDCFHIVRACCSFNATATVEAWQRKVLEMVTIWRVPWRAVHLCEWLTRLLPTWTTSCLSS